MKTQSFIEKSEIRLQNLKKKSWRTKELPSRASNVQRVDRFCLMFAHYNWWQSRRRSFVSALTNDVGRSEALSAECSHRHRLKSLFSFLPWHTQQGPSALVRPGPGQDNIVLKGLIDKVNYSADAWKCEFSKRNQSSPKKWVKRAHHHNDLWRPRHGSLSLSLHREGRSSTGWSVGWCGHRKKIILSINDGDSGTMCIIIKRVVGEAKPTTVEVRRPGFASYLELCRRVIACGMVGGRNNKLT